MRELENLRKTSVRDFEVLVDGRRRRSQASDVDEVINSGQETVSAPGKSGRARGKPLQKDSKVNLCEVIKENGPQAAKKKVVRKAKRQPLRSLQAGAAAVRSPAGDLPVTIQHIDGGSSQRKRMIHKKVLLNGRSAKKKIRKEVPRESRSGKSKKSPSTESAHEAQAARGPINLAEETAREQRRKKRRVDSESDKRDAHDEGDETEILEANETEILRAVHTKKRNAESQPESKEPAAAHDRFDAETSGRGQDAENKAESAPPSKERRAKESDAKGKGPENNNTIMVDRLDKAREETSCMERLKGEEKETGAAAAAAAAEASAETTGALNEEHSRMIQKRLRRIPLEELGKEHGATKDLPRPKEREEQKRRLHEVQQKRSEQASQQQTGGNCEGPSGGSWTREELLGVIEDQNVALDYYKKELRDAEEEIIKLKIVDEELSTLRIHKTQLGEKIIHLELTNYNLENKIQVLEEQVLLWKEKMKVEVSSLTEKLKVEDGEKQALRDQLALLQERDRGSHEGGADKHEDQDCTQELPKEEGATENGVPEGAAKDGTSDVNGELQTPGEVGEGDKSCTGVPTVPSKSSEGGIHAPDVATNGTATTASGAAAKTPVAAGPSEDNTPCSQNGDDTPDNPLPGGGGKHPWGAMLCTPTLPVAPTPPQPRVSSGWASQLGTPFGDKTPAWHNGKEKRRPPSVAKTMSNMLRRSSVSGWKDMLVRATSHSFGHPLAGGSDPFANPCLPGDSNGVPRDGGERDAHRGEQREPQTTASPAGSSRGNDRTVDRGGSPAVDSERRVGGGECVLFARSEGSPSDGQLVPVNAAEVAAIGEMLRFLTGFKVEVFHEGARQYTVFKHEETGYTFSLSTYEDEDSEMEGDDSIGEAAASDNSDDEPEEDKILYRPITFGMLDCKLPGCLRCEILVPVSDASRFQRKIMTSIHC